MRNHEYGDCNHPEERFCNASKQDPLEPAAAMRANYNKAGVSLA